MLNAVWWSVCSYIAVATDVRNDLTATHVVNTQRLTQRQTMLMMGIPSPDLAAIAIEAGVGTIIVDAEHGFPLGSGLRQLVLACRAARGRCLVRVAPTQRHHLGVLADLGVDGVVLSLVRSQDELAAATASVRFPPSGGRSINPFVPASTTPGDVDGLRAAAEKFELWLMAETHELLEELRDADRSAEVGSWSGAIIGPYDLAAALECPMDPECDPLRRAVADYASWMDGHMIAWSLFVRDLPTLERWVSVGIDPPAVVIGYDRDMWAHACATRVNTFS
jgi:2-keto-3-deoxy-L-rhamnonate aldolase RhmA